MSDCAICKGNGFYGTPGGRCDWCNGTGRAPGTASTAPTVEASILQLVNALVESKGWTRGYADAVIRDAIDRREGASK